MNNEMDAVTFNRLFNSQDILSKEEEKQLIKQAATGDEKSKKILVLSNLKYAKQFADRIKFSNIDKDDLYLECILGLIKATDHVNPEYDNSFLTYANWWMKAAVNEAMNKSGNSIKIPDKKFRSIRKVRAIYGREMELCGNDKKSRMNTARELNITDYEVNEFLMISESIVSLEELFMTNDFTCNYEMSLEDSVIESFSRMHIREIVKRLPKKEADVLIKHFGLNGYPPMSFSEIGAAYGLTKAWANGMEKKARKHLLQYADELEQLIA